MIDEENRPYHKVANIFPMMNDDEYIALKLDIAKNGLLEPIWLHPDGSIIDGRNRHMACIQTGRKPTFKIWQGEEIDLIKFVVSLNLHRRHLNESQRQLIAAEIEQYKHGDNQHTGDANLHLLTRTAAAQMLNVSERGIANAAKVKNNGVPELSQAIKNGQVSAYAAAAVAELPPAEQIAITLQGPRAVVEKSKEIREQKRQERRQERIERIAGIAKGNRPLSAEVGQFPVIYADPPWEYDFSETDSRRIDNQYPTMTLEEIKAMALGDISTPDAILFLWATSPLLPKAFAVIESWGFSYKASIVWDKEKIGMGYYARIQHELLLIATKGQIPVPKPANRPRSVYRENYNGHSVKPDYFYSMIEDMYPTLPKIELFSRERREGWAAWGNQV